MNIKDKLKLFNRIRDDKHAGADFRLLVAKVPSYPYITRFSRDVRRYAYDILYALLDVASEEEIVENRKLLDSENSKDASVDSKKVEKKTSSNTLTGKKQEKKNTPKKTPKQGSSKTSSKNAESKSESKEEEIAEDGSSKTLTGDSSKKK